MTMPFKQKLSHVSLLSPNFEATLRFYVDVLGCGIAHEFINPQGERYGAFLHFGSGTFLELFNTPQNVPAGGRFRHFCIEVDDLEQVAAYLTERGYSAVPRRGRTDRTLQLFIHDPDGTEIEFQQHDAQSALYEFVRGTPPV